MRVKDSRFMSNFVYPFCMRGIPVDGLTKGVGEIMLRPPAQLLADMSGINGIPPIMSRPVGNILYHIIPLLKIFKNCRCNVSITDLVVRTDVIHRAGRPAQQT